MTQVRAGRFAFHIWALAQILPVSLCGAAEFTVKVATYPATGTLSGQPSHTSVSNYGNKPLVLLNGNADNGFDVAFHLNSASRIRILQFDSTEKMTGALQPDSIVGAKALLGLARITDDNGFAVIYSKDSPHSGSGYEFWCTRVDAAGAKTFTKMIFGDGVKNVFWSKGEPGTFSSGRLLYNKASKKLALYVGHTMAWSPDTVRHQAGYLAFMSLDGSFVTPNDWYSSHNFDQRLMLVGNDYYTLAHGDAYPRALGFAKWTDGGAKGTQVFDKQFLKIPGSVGDNKTSTQLGSFVSFPDGTFGVSFTTANGRNGFDVAYRQLSAAGDSLPLQWVTSYPSGTFALYPKIAKHGDDVLLMWEEVVGTANNGIQMALLTPKGAVVTPKFPLADKTIRLSPYYDLTALPNGKILWANQKGNDSVSIYKLVESAPTSLEGSKAHAGPAMRLEYLAGRLTLTASRAGRFRIRQFDAGGKVLSESRESFPSGSHAIPLRTGKVSLVEVASGSERKTVSVIP
ncbi:MAG: putative lipoprotein [Fibrobacteres bacterium]|nr:putative lipoprotein [Fibrobacterota bacterium]